MGNKHGTLFIENRGCSTVLTYLALEKGYVLDYVYFAPGGDGATFLYARRESEPAFANYSEYEKAGVESYLSYIQVDGAAECYYELVVLSIMGVQFYFLGILSIAIGKL